MRPRAAYWGYPTTHTIPGDLPVNLGALADNVTKRSTPRPEAAERWARYTRGVRAAAIEQAGQLSSQATDFVSAADLFRELHDALPDDAICVDEITAQVPQMIQFLHERKPFSQYRGWAGALGTGLGTALGVKLARPQQVVVCILGDGAWHYNPIPAALGFAQEYGVPLLIALCNKPVRVPNAESPEVLPPGRRGPRREFCRQCYPTHARLCEAGRSLWRRRRTRAEVQRAAPGAAARAGGRGLGKDVHARRHRQPVGDTGTSSGAPDLDNRRALSRFVHAGVRGPAAGDAIQVWVTDDGVNCAN